MKLKRAGIFTKIVITVLLVYAVSTLAGLYSQVNDANGELDRLRDTLDSQHAKNAELEYAIENSDDPAIIEDFARENLDLAYPDEEVFYTE